MPRFSIEILSQGWIDEKYADYDLSSHGVLRVFINNIEITDQDEYQDTYGVNEAALALLRTLEQDHAPEESPYYLIPHGCNAFLMERGCPIGIDWKVTHAGNQILISDITRHNETSDEPTCRFPEAETAVNLKEYRAEILQFARDAKGLFDASPPRRFEGRKRVRLYNQQMHEDFWAEFNNIYQRQSLLLD